MRIPVGREAIYEYEYERNGASNLLMLSAPVKG